MKQLLTSELISMEAPYTFTDAMTDGLFHSFTHTHTHDFTQADDITIMKDTFHYVAPFGILGKIADRLFLEKYMNPFIKSHAKNVKRLAEKHASE